MTEATRPSLISLRRRTMTALWFTYAAYYLGRVNLSAAIPGISSELGYTKEDLGWVLALLKIGYAAGQFINGQLADRLSAHKLLALGLLGSALCNIFFGAAAALEVFAFLWLTNGYFQAMGWTPCVKIITRWTAGSERGRAMGVLGTSYQVGSALVLLLAGPLVEWTGEWRTALYVPAAVLAVGAFFVWRTGYDDPQEAGVPAAELPPRMSEEVKRLPVWRGLLLALGNWQVWLLALSLAAVNLARYGFLDWAPTHLKEVQGIGIGKAAMQAALLPAGGILGAYAAGWISDKLFGARRGPVIVGMLLALCATTLLYGPVARVSVFGAIVLLGLSGFFLYGPQVLIVGAAAADLARGGSVGTTAGFINMMGYVGAACGDALTGLVAHRSGWDQAVWLWAGAAGLAAVLIIPLWRARPRA